VADAPEAIAGGFSRENEATSHNNNRDKKLAKSIGDVRVDKPSKAQWRRDRDEVTLLNVVSPIPISSLRLCAPAVNLLGNPIATLEIDPVARENVT
jgi:hypothetical protein